MFSQISGHPLVQSRWHTKSPSQSEIYKKLHFAIIIYLPDILTNILHRSSFRIILQARHYYHPHFTGEETKVRDENGMLNFKWLAKDRTKIRNIWSTFMLYNFMRLWYHFQNSYALLGRHIRIIYFFLVMDKCIIIILVEHSWQLSNLRII